MLRHYIYYKQNCLFWAGFTLIRLSLFLPFLYDIPGSCGSGYYKLPMQAKLIALIIFNPKINKNVSDRHQRGKVYLSSVLNSLKSIINADFLPLVSHYVNEKW